MKGRKLFRRLHAEQYLLLTLISFAASVSFTRLLLYLTGYPQLGNSELHIAHVLWGGLLLFVACLSILVFANRVVRIWGSILAGVGVGLFIDEVGKFITQSNNYFFPPAAPIIYALFLLTVLIYSVSRSRKKADPRSELYAVTQQLEEMLDHELTNEERQEMLIRLKFVERTAQEIELRELATSLRAFLEQTHLKVTNEKLDIIEKTAQVLKKMEANYFSERVMRILIAVGLVILSGWMLVKPLLALIYSNDLGKTQMLFAELIKNNLVASLQSQVWYLAILVMQVALSIVFFVAAVLMISKASRIAFSVSYVGLLLTLTALNLLVFYYDQFSTIFSALFEFILLLCLLRFRQRFIHAESA